jgi:hypothetical protein
MIHFASSGVSDEDQRVQPEPAQVEQRAFSGMRLSCWGIG